MGKLYKRYIRRWMAFLLAAIMLTGMGITAQAAQEEELRGVWISYLEWEKWPSEKTAFQKEVDQVLDHCVSLGMNAVFVHVRPDSDAMYPSEYFPWSKFITGVQGKNPGYDPLAYFIQAAHKRGLKFHAWINPYRVTGYLNRWGDVAETNPAKVWLTDQDSSNDRWVLKHSGEYYYNPAVPQVRELIINGVKEIVNNYDVDGIHFDDYFYPSIENGNSGLWFDKPEYDASSSTLEISDWRRENINQLVKGVYSAVKGIKPQVQFGISPEGYINNLRSEKRLFVDVDTWLSKSGYVDYIMPQIYWGFETRTSDGKLAPFAFDNNLKTWSELKKKGNARLYLGLAMYKTATDTKDYNEIPEWLRYNDIMKRQVEAARKNGNVSGFCFYSYSSFQRDEAQTEVENLKKAFQ